MKLRNVLIVAVLSGIAFTSCRDNQRGTIDDDVRIERDRTTTSTDARTTPGMTNDNNVSARLQRNRNLSTFNEGLTRNQIDMQRGTATTTTTGTQAGTQTTGQEYTIFAPSNDAYNNLTETQRNQFMDAQNRDRNTASMNYLMVDQRLTRDQLRQHIESGNGTHTIRTMQGENITATMDGNTIVLRDGAGNQARITESDNEGSDGVIHVIDRVLMPQDPNRNEAGARTGTGTNRTGTGTTTGGTTTDRNTRN